MVAPDIDWGYDHGTWGVLDLLFPGRHIPTLAMSLDRTKGAEHFLALGAALAPLRGEGVMIVGSGNVIHNLALAFEHLREYEQALRWVRVALSRDPRDVEFQRLEFRMNVLRLRSKIARFVKSLLRFSTDD